MKTEVPSALASSSVPLYARLLGEAWPHLDAPLRKAHLDGERLCLGGTFRVRRGTGLLAMAAGVFVSGLRDIYAALGLPYGNCPWTNSTSVPSKGGS